MATPGQRAKRRSSPPTRVMQLGLDGESFDVVLTRADERNLRRQLSPFVAAARRANPTPSLAGQATQPRLSAQLRAARTEALLGITSSLPPLPATDALGPLLAKTAEYYSRSLTDQTRGTYRRRWERFSGWCDQHGLDNAPAEPATVMIYLASMVDQEVPPSLSTLRGHVNAINRVHAELDLPVPGDDPAMNMLMRGLSHQVPSTRAADPMDALRIEDLRAVCRYLELPDPRLLRDRAIIALVAVGVPAAIVARLRWQDLRFTDRQAVMRERRAKNAGPTTTRKLPASGDAACPVHALRAWRDVAGSGPPLVFTLLDRDGRRDARGLGPSGVAQVVATRVDSLLGEASGNDFLKVTQLLSMAPADAVRDRALLLLGFAMAARRGELTDLVWSDLRNVDEGLLVRLRRSKTDLDGRGTTLGIPWGRSLSTCPVRAVATWRTRVELQLGQEEMDASPVFVRVGRGGRITPDEPLTREAITMVVRRRMSQAGIKGRWGGRSLRAGLISTAADLDLPLELIAQQSRHASLDSLVRYIRHDDVFRRNAADRIGL
ncbi:MAG: hypothetical protein JWL79_1763 [Frankiales bacterium]|nr:hypothetical protein [Frankiales bacterium]